MVLQVSIIKLVKKFTLFINDPMKTLMARKTLKALTALTILFGESTLHAEAPPQNPETPSLISEIGKMLTVDLDAKIKELGLRVHSCELVRDNSMEKRGSEMISSYPSLQSCLTDSLIRSLNGRPDKNLFGQEVLYIKLWALDTEGRYLPPIIVRWRHSHKGLLSLLSEGLRLKTDRLSEYLTSINSLDVVSKPCKLSFGDSSRQDFQQSDFGNIIGDLEISATETKNLSDYFEPGRLKSILAATKPNSIIGNIKVPKVVNGARIYDAELKIGTELEVHGDLERIDIRIRSNINFLALNGSPSPLIRLLNLFVRKTFCVHGNLEAFANEAEVQ